MKERYWFPALATVVESFAVALGLVLLMISFIVNLLLRRWQGRGMAA